MLSIRSSVPILLLLASQPSAAQESLPVSRDVFHKIVIAHAVLAATAWVIFFPVGAILVRVVTRNTFWTHASTQVIATLIFTAGWALGVYIATVTDQWLAFNGHPIIGTVIFGLLWLQAPLGLLHHLRWKKTGNSTVYAWIHVWLGRILITAGIINGGLGLQLSGNTTWGEILYGVIAGVVFIIYASVSIAAAIRNRGGKRETGQKLFGKRNNSDSGSSDDQTVVGGPSDEFNEKEKRQDASPSPPFGQPSAQNVSAASESVPSQQQASNQVVYEHAAINSDEPFRMASPPSGTVAEDIVHGGTHLSSTANRLDPHIQV